MSERLAPVPFTFTEHLLCAVPDQGIKGEGSGTRAWLGLWSLASPLVVKIPRQLGLSGTAPLPCGPISLKSFPEPQFPHL